MSVQSCSHAEACSCRASTGHLCSTIVMLVVPLLIGPPPRRLIPRNYEVQPALPGAHVGDVPDELVPGPVRGEVAGQQVRRRAGTVAIGRALVRAGLAGHQAM